MLDGIHTLASLEDAVNGFEYTSVQVSVSDDMIPTATGLGTEVKARNHVTKGEWLNFDGTMWYAVTPTT
eukprot:6881121-Prorocentrum_lima.AAC.1